MSHKERYVGLAVVTAVSSIVKVKPIGWAHDRMVTLSNIKSKGGT